jgi:hypothetical protein
VLAASLATLRRKVVEQRHCGDHRLRLCKRVRGATVAGLRIPRMAPQYLHASRLRYEYFPNLIHRSGSAHSRGAFSPFIDSEFAPMTLTEEEVHLLSAATHGNGVLMVPNFLRKEAALLRLCELGFLALDWRYSGSECATFALTLRGTYCARLLKPEAVALQAI